MQRFLLVALAVLFANSLSALTVSGDITTDTTWTYLDSPITLDPAGASGGTIKVRAGKTLTIDSTGGAVIVQWNEDCDLQIGNGSGDDGNLVIKAASGAITFKVHDTGNIRIDPYGSITFSNTTATTTFTELTASNGWGALVFEAGQTKQSALKKCAFTAGGGDSKDGAIVVENSASYVPTLENLTFTGCTTSAIHLKGNGINVLKEGNLILPFDVSSTTYVLFLDAVASTAVTIRFPDVTTPASPEARLDGTCQAGDSSNTSHWRFDDDWTFKCASGSKVQAVNGSVWGTTESQPKFQAISGSGYTDWDGLVDDSTTKANLFGDVGPFAYLEVRNASMGIDLNKGTSYVPVTGYQTTWRFPGLIVKKCDTGIRVRTFIDTSDEDAGYTTTLDGATIGDSNSSDNCSTACVTLDYGRLILSNCLLKGAVTDCIDVGTESSALTSKVTVRDCRISGSATTPGNTAINLKSTQGKGVALIERTTIQGYNRAIAFTQSSNYNPIRTLTAKRSFITCNVATSSNSSGTGIDVQVQSNQQTSPCSVSIDDCTILAVPKDGSGTARGLWCQDLSSYSTMTVRRTNIDSCTDYGVHVISAATNTCQYTFDECSFTANGGTAATNEGGIFDVRTQNAKIVAKHCTFAGNYPWGVSDGYDTADADATYCYWNDSSGPSYAGPGTGEAVTLNVDFTPFLTAPYFNSLIGGSPASASTWDVKETSTTDAENLHVIANRPYFVWTFASDFTGDTQASYEIDVSTNPAFGAGTFRWDGSKTAETTNAYAQYPATGGSVLSLDDGVVYYARIRLWNQDDRVGPWRYVTFRMNTAPGTVSGGSPTGGGTIGDATPQLQWDRAFNTDPEEDPLHYYVQVDTTTNFNSGNLRTIDTAVSLGTGGSFDYSTDGGTTWLTAPLDGIPAPSSGNYRVRLTLPHTYPNALGTLTNTTWYWRVKANDRFEQSASYSSNYNFVLTRKYNLSGRLTTVGGGNPGSGEEILVRINGAAATKTGSSDTNGSGDFTFQMTSDAKVGDTLVLYLNRAGGSPNKCARVVHFTGADMSGLDLREERAYVQQGLSSKSVTNTDFAGDSGDDADIPWTETSGAVAFDFGTSTDGEIYVLGQWNCSGSVTATANNPLLRVEAGGSLVTQGQAVSTYDLEVDGTLEVNGGSLFTVTNSADCDETLKVFDSTFRLQKASTGINLTISRVFQAQNSTFDVNTGGVSTLTFNGGYPSDVVLVDCVGCVFSKVGVVFENDARLVQFNYNTFKDGISTRHIYWKCTEIQSTTIMRGIQFDYSLTQGSQYNVEATTDSGIRILTMLACGGVRAGETYDGSGGGDGNVVWITLPVLDVKVSTGYNSATSPNGVNRVEWTRDDQADISTLGYNVYQSRIVDGGKWTSVTYDGGTNKTTFTNTGASFTSFVAVNDQFYPRFTSTTKLTVTDVSSDYVKVSGNQTSAGSVDDLYSFFVRVNGSLLSGSTVAQNAASLVNNTKYYYYVAIDDSSEDAPSNRIRSNQVSVTTPNAAASISLLAPNSGAQNTTAAVTVVGKGTHWDGSATLTISGTNVTVNDTIFLSPTLALTDFTIASGASTGARTVTVTRNDVWTISTFDESDTETFTINGAANEDRPTVAFVTTGGAIAENANTAGVFKIRCSFTTNGGGNIDTATFEFYASRTVQVDGSPVTTVDPGNNLGQGANSIFDGVSDNLSTSYALCNIEQTSNDGEELFSTGEYTVYARVGNVNGRYSDWVSRRFYVEGAGASVAKTTTLLKQGDTNVQVAITSSAAFSGTIDGVSFGANIATVSFTKNNDSSIYAYVSVDQLAECGPRTFTVDRASGTDPVGIVVVEYPTNILPTTTNAEPNRNPAIGGVNVFLKNGAFFKSETDIATRGRMMGISWSRFYRSDITYNGPLGQKWVGHYYQRVVFEEGGGGPGGDPDNIHWYTPDGRKETFSGNQFDAPAGVYVKATRDTTYSTITLTDRHGFRCVFNAQGRLWKCIDRNGNTSTCAYNYAGQLTTITDDRAKTYNVIYHTHGRVDRVQDKVWDTGLPREVEYDYDSYGDLREQKAPTTPRYDGSPLPRITYGYRYDSSHRMTACINPREFAQSGNPTAYLENQYESGKVVNQRLGEPDQWIYIRYESGTLIRIVDRRGLRTDYTIDGTGRATAVKRFTDFWTVDTDDPIDHSVKTGAGTKVRASDPTSFDTTFTYNGDNEITSVLYPRGNKVTYAYPNGTSQTNGTATSCSANVLTKTGAGWTTNAFVGMTLRMGPASNRMYYLIVSNTSTTITVDPAFSLSGDGWGASTYNVFDQSSDPLAAGNVLTVTRSDEGLGSESDIVTTYTYEPRYQFVKTVKNPRNYTTTYTYDYEDTALQTDKYAGNLVKVTSPNIDAGQPSTQSIVTRTTYNQYGQPVGTVDGEGNVTHFKYYDAGARDGFLYQVVNAYGALDLTSEFDYNNVGSMIATWPARAFESGATKDDFKTVYEVNELDQTWHTTGPKLRIGGSDKLDVYRYFDANGNVTHAFREYVNDAGSEPSAPSDVLDPTSFSKSSSPMAATWVEANTVYNLLNYPTERTLDAVAGSTVTRLTSQTIYDANYNVVQGISPLGNRSATVYDERDMIFQSIAGEYSDVRAVFESDYDHNGNLKFSRDALDNQTEYSYDGFDRTTIVKDPAGNERKSYYDANSNVIKSEAYAGAVGGTLLACSEGFFDEIDRAYKSRRLFNNYAGVPAGDGYSDSITLFDKNSRVSKSTGDNGASFYRFYDAASRTLYTRDAVGNEVHFEYNAGGAATKSTYREINYKNGVCEVSHESSSYDYLNRRLKFQDRRYNASTKDTEIDWKYDGWGRVTQTTDADGTTTDMIYDLLSRSVRTTRKPSGTDSTWIITDNNYDDDSRVVMRTIWETGDDTTPTNPQDTTYQYDERGRMTLLRRADGDIWTFSYDANSNRLGWTDPLGTAVTDTYDNRNLIAYRNISRGSTVKGATYESYQFDGLGRLQSCSNYDGSKLISASSWQYNTLSQPERLTQTICKSDGAVLGTYTTGCEFDGSGFNTALIYASGRVIRNQPDALNRLMATTDDTNDEQLAAYVYAGPHRLVMRTFNCGDSSHTMRTNYEYESSGCGCGGFSSFCEKVEHVRLNGSNTEILFSTERRYDKVGNVTAERVNHQGAVGSVYRYDDAYRLTTVFTGTDMYSGNLDTYAGGTDPTAFGSKRTYNLDTRGNRTGSDGVAEEDDQANPIKDTNFTVGGSGTQAEINARLMNVYTSIDGDSFTYDAAEQMTHDPSTGLYHAYDYKGQLILTDDESDFSIPERRYGYDNQGRRKVEEIWYEASEHNYANVVTTDFPVCESCNCNSTGTFTAGDATLDGSTGTVMSTIDTILGQGAAVSRSGNAVHPATAATVRGGSLAGNSIVIEAYDTNTISPTYLYRCETISGSLAGTLDATALRTHEYIYDEFGKTANVPILYDMTDDRITGVTNDGTYTVIGTSVTLTADALLGREISVCRPAAASNRVATGRIIDNNTSQIFVMDPSADVYNALNAQVQGFVVLDLVDANEYRAAGTWTQAPTYNTPTAGRTRFYDELAAQLDASDIGHWLCADITAAGGTYTGWFPVVAIGDTWVEVTGNKTSGVTTGDTYMICDQPYPTFSSGNDRWSYSGTWSEDAVCTNGVTDLVDDQATFVYFQSGCILIPDITKPAMYAITTNGGGTVSVNADLSAIITAGMQYRILCAPGVSGDTGALASPSDLGNKSNKDGGSRYLWMGYRYDAPMVGVYVNPGAGLGIYGEQPGTSELGSYYCWNRIYSPHLGRWTTPDPAASPWWNLQDYCDSAPLQSSDPVGLATDKPEGEYRADIKETQLPKGTPSNDTPPVAGVRDTVTSMGITVYFAPKLPEAPWTFLEDGYIYGERTDTLCASSQKVTYWRKYERTRTGTFNVYRSYLIRRFITGVAGKQYHASWTEYALLYSVEGKLYEIATDSWEYLAYVWICTINPPGRDDTKKMGEVGSKTKWEKGEKADSTEVNSSTPIVPPQK
ncbi:MAG: hypothetical protein IT462_05360 [Planctomycetes bacterium]|nr:hypothetical protein [Planctomycetota bacterium]